LIDLSGWTQIEIRGNDRVKFLHNFCTNDIRGLARDCGCEAFITSVQGKVLAHIFVLAREQTLAFICVPDCADRIISHLSRYQISEDVIFDDQTARRGHDRSRRGRLRGRCQGGAGLLSALVATLYSLVQPRKGEWRTCV
jgi:folate-binding Fe-S cluster repair protein YgfZ